MGIAPASSGSAVGDTSYLVQGFREFFAELVEWKRVLSGVTAPGVGRAEKSPDATARTVSDHLLGVLDRQALEARRVGGRFALDAIQDAQYLKSALGDEILLDVEWHGREDWTSNLLETSLFQTRVAGEKVFERMDQLLQERDQSKRPLAVLYLLALTLGFEGMYRGAGYEETLQAYRLELYRFIYNREPSLEKSERLFAAQAYDFTLKTAVPQKLPNAVRWVVIFLVVAVGLLGASELLWVWKTTPLESETASAAALDAGGMSR